MTLRAPLLAIVAPLAVAIFTLNPEPCRASLIGVDARANSSDSGAILATGSSFDEFRSVIAAEGHTIVPLTSFQPGDLAGLSAVILQQDDPPFFLAGETAALDAFVAGGGGLLIAGEGGYSTNATVNDLNAFTQPYGVTYGPSPQSPAGLTFPAPFAVHPVTEGVASIGVDYFRPIVSISLPAIDLTLGVAPDILAVVDGVGGAGNAAFISDTSLWLDSDILADRTMAFGGNQRLLENLLGYITARVPEPSGMVMAVAAWMAACRASRRR